MAYESKCNGTARYMRYAVRVAGFLSLFGVAWQIVYPPRYPYIDSASAVFLMSSPTVTAHK